MKLDEVEGRFEQRLSASDLLNFRKRTTTIRNKFLLILKCLPDQIAPGASCNLRSQRNRVEKQANQLFTIEALRTAIRNEASNDIGLAGQRTHQATMSREENRANGKSERIRQVL